MNADLPPLPEEDGRCAGCGFDFAAMSVDDASALVGTMPTRYREAVAATSPTALCLRPGDGTWSKLEYLCHVRDVFASYTIRLYRTRTEERPAVEPMLNDLRAARFRYNELNPAAVLDELERNVAGFLDEVARVQDWNRVATRLPHEERTARWLVRQATHEGSHHLDDFLRIRERRT